MKKNSFGTFLSAPSKEVVALLSGTLAETLKFRGGGEESFREELSQFINAVTPHPVKDGWVVNSVMAALPDEARELLDKGALWASSVFGRRWARDNSWDVFSAYVPIMSILWNGELLTEHNVKELQDAAWEEEEIELTIKEVARFSAHSIIANEPEDEDSWEEIFKWSVTFFTSGDGVLLYEEPSIAAHSAKEYKYFPSAIEFLQQASSLEQLPSPKGFVVAVGAKGTEKEGVFLRENSPEKQFLLPLCEGDFQKIKAAFEKLYNKEKQQLKVGKSLPLFKPPKVRWDSWVAFSLFREALF